MATMLFSAGITCSHENGINNTMYSLTTPLPSQLSLANCMRKQLQTLVELRAVATIAAQHFNANFALTLPCMPIFASWLWLCSMQDLDM